jgi:hypothetical protein
MNLNSRSCILLLSLFSFAVHADIIEDNSTCDQSENIEFVINDIFDLSESDTIFLHYWANALHNRTKEITLINESAFFIKKCQVSEADLIELERLLRLQKYIRDAAVKFGEDGKILVETWDTWSLTPTLEYGRKGGINKYAIGIKERNLIGLGIDADIEYFSDDQRTGYKFDTQFPLFLKQNITGSLRFTSNSDGSSQAVFLDKRFASFDTPYAYRIGFDNFKQIDTQFQNGLDIAKYNHDKTLATVNWQWLYEDTTQATIRYGIGFTKEEHTFSELEDPMPEMSGFLPLDRRQQYPFVNAEYIQKDYRELTNFNLINQIEDFNMGWHFNALLGRDFSNNALSPDLIWRSSAKKGVQTSDKGYLFFDARFNGELHSNVSAQDSYRFDFSTEYFHKINDRWGAYLKNANTLSKNPYFDMPVTIGDDSGVRGYPLQYQHGTSSSQVTLEARYYPHINIYKVFELGGAAFVDAGKTFGDSPVENLNPSTLVSVGLGARLYSSHSSEAHVIHFDIIKPLSTDDNVSSLEFRVTTKQSF